jgi:hypothetical protein
MSDDRKVSQSGTPSSGPSHDRIWRPEQAILPYADLSDTRVIVHHVRDARYRSNSDYDVRHRDIEFQWDEIVGVDFLLSPFPNNSWLAHTMLSFRRHHGNPLVVSIEARLEQNEKYHPWDGARRRYELMYVLAEETDVIPLRTEVRTGANDAAGHFIASQSDCEISRMVRHALQ